MKADRRYGHVCLAAVPLAVLLWPGVGWAHGTAGKPVHDHSQHPICRELKVSLEVVAVGKPEALVLLRSDFQRRGMGLREGHGVKFYVNGKRAHVNPDVNDGSYEWLLDMTLWPAAEHYVTINVCDHHDHIGVATLRLKPGELRGQAPPGHGLFGQLWGHGGDFVVDGAYVGCCGNDGMWPDRADATSSVGVTDK